MSRPSSKKKEAVRLWNKFKETYNKLEVNDCRLKISDTPCDIFWQENRPSDREVAEEIVKLVNNEPIEYKILLANVRFGDFQIPQKKWFLGSMDSTELLPRQPLNMFGYFCSQMVFGQPRKSSFIHLYQMFSYLTRPRKLRIVNSGFSIVVELEDNVEVFIDVVGKECSIHTEPDTLFNSEQRKKLRQYRVSNEYLYRGVKISLVDGKLVSEKDVVIYLADQKVNQKILQWELKSGGDELLLLFETFFMASGKIHLNKSGYLIKCQEVHGSYGTGAFAISPDFTFLVRETAVNKNPLPSRPMMKINRLKKMVHKINLCENYWATFSFPEYQIAPRGAELLNYMCFHSRILLKMKKEFVNDPAPNFYLSPFETFIYNFHLSKGTTYEPMDFNCNHKNGQCCHMKDLVVLGKSLIEEDTDKRGDIANEFIYATTNMLEIYYIAIILNKEYYIPCHVNELIQCYNGYYPYPIMYYPYGLYILDRPIEEMEFAITCLTQEITAPWFRKFHQLGRTMAVVLEKRPDMILFSDSKLNLPIQLIKDFAKWYQEEHYDRLNPKASKPVVKRQGKK